MSEGVKVAQDVMKMLLADGLNEKLSKATPDETAEIVRILVSNMTLVSSKLIVTYLMKLVSEGESPDVVTAQASKIIELTAQHLDQTVTFELAAVVEMMSDLVESQKATSH